MKFIYKLCDDKQCYYVGQTNSLENRFRQHKQKKNYGGGLIPEGIVWRMELLEEVEDEKSYEREKYWYDTLTPLYNKRRPGQSFEEYCALNPEKRKQKNKEWNLQNKEYKMNYNAMYFEENKERLVEYARQQRERRKDEINARRRELYKLKNGFIPTGKSKKE